MPVMRARAAEEGGEEGAAHSATSGAYPLLPADGCYLFPLYPYLNRLCTSSVQGCYHVMTRSGREYRTKSLCQVFRQREQLGCAAASLFAAADTLHKSLRTTRHHNTHTQAQLEIDQGTHASLPFTEQDVSAETSFTQASRQKMPLAWSMALAWPSHPPY